MTRRQRQYFRAWRFAKHLRRFVDYHRFPNFRVTSEIVRAESKRQSHGDSRLTASEILLTAPLRDAQRWKEVTIDGLVDEMGEWWANGWGWWYPMAAEVGRIRADWIMKKALLEIRRRCEKDFIEFLVARGGCERFIRRKADTPSRAWTSA